MTTAEQLDRAIGQVRTALAILDQVHGTGKVNSEGMFSAPEDRADIEAARKRLSTAVDSLFFIE